MADSVTSGVAWLAELPDLRLVRTHGFGSDGRRLASGLAGERALAESLPAGDRSELLDACRRARPGVDATCHHSMRVQGKQVRCCTTVRRHRGGRVVGFTQPLAEQARSSTDSSLLAHIPGLALALDSDLRIREAVGAWKPPRPRAELLGARLDELLPPRDRTDVRAALKADGRVAWEAEAGERIACVNVSRGDAGFAALVYDAPERVRAIDALRASAERLRTLVQASPDAVFLKDGEGRWLEANQAALDMFGLAGTDYRGRTDVELAEGSEDYGEALRHCQVTDEQAWQAGTKVRDEEVITHPDGSARVFDVVKVPLFNPDGSRKSFVVLGRDITDRRRLEEQRDRLLHLESAGRASAEKARRRSEFLASASRALAQSLDLESTTRTAARLAVPLLADFSAIDLFDAGEPVRAATAGLESCETPDACLPPAELPALAEVAETGRTQFWANTDGVWAPWEESTDDGSMRPCRAFSVAMEARGRTIGVITFGRASSPLTPSEQDLVLLEELARRAALSIDNARLYREATDAVRAREEFLAVASHELRTPLTTMQLGVQWLLKYARAGRLAELPQSTVLRILENADRQRHRLGKLVDRLLTGARIGEGKLELPLEEIALEDVVRDVLAGLSEEAEHSGSRIEVHAEPVTGRWEPFRLGQIATSLISNAIKYGEGKPITIEIGEEEPGIAVLRVIDQGIGIAPERLARIFERFERAASWRHYSGLGLGLFVARKLAAELGGTITADSELGKGSTFEVRLPTAGPDVSE